jgi:hypothetical protein
MCGLSSILGAIVSPFIGKKISKSSSAPAPAATTTVAPPTQTNITTGSEALEAGRSAKQKAAAAQGYQSTIMTGPSGVTGQATTRKKTLLGE